MVADLRAVTLEGRGRSIVLLRHGQTAWNAEGRAQGHTDVGLDDTGREQAEAVAPVLAALDPVLLVTSDLARARETAAFLEKETGLTAVEDPRWREYDLGERTGLTLAEFGERIGAEFDGWWDVHAHVEVAGAESPAQLADRVLPAFEEVLGRLGEDETAVVVTHGASLRVAVAGILGWPIETATDLEAMDNCGWATLAETGSGRLRLSSYNRTVAGPPPD
ncbi:MAG: histidine phosphatase family protein [Marmoricola sp.]